MNKDMEVRFGLDIGIASVGWAVVSEDYEVLEAGSNIFESADAGKNADRRSFRQGKRLLRRRHTRIKDFENFWSRAGLGIPCTSCNGQLMLRVKGLNEQLSQDEVYFVLRNMLTHRGIAYLDDALDETSSGKSSYKKGISINEKELKEYKYPCIIQLERLNKYGSYRGEQIINDEGGEQITLSNVFTVGAYREEIKALLQKQGEFHDFIDEDFADRYIEIFSRKREYYVGPGNEKSRTDYGKYTTKINPDTGKYITEENIFEKLIGKCSIYTDEVRAAGASYTAQEFNILNDLNNLCINGRKLTKEEKTAVIDEVKISKTVSMRKIIKKVIGEDIETMTGARIDKDEKEIFHNFEQFRKLRQEFGKRELDFSLLSVDDLDKIGNILTLNTEKEAILSAVKREMPDLSHEITECIIDFRRKNGNLFNKWHSFSLKIMKELIPEMYEMPENQMEILTRWGKFKANSDIYKEYSKVPKGLVTEEIYNPVVRRSIRITVDIVNALIKKYGYPKEIVIEMPRDRNSDEESKRINDEQKRNEKELKDIKKRINDEYGISITEEDFRNHKKLALKLKLWNEQDGKCLYSGRDIAIPDLLNEPDMFEVDHIIPKSISFDDSRSNKVLVYRSENQKKGNLTPYMYLSTSAAKWGFEEYKAEVMRLKDKKLISRKKAANFLNTEDITKVEVLKGFISRNINDTRYASRVVLNTLQGYFKAKETDTKVKVIRGSFTNQMRNAMKLDKDREKSYAHHAVDAMLICFSQMGYKAYRTLLSEFIDFETGEITDEKKYEEYMCDRSYDELMYQNKWMTIKKNIQAAERKVKYWHKIDKKPNRGLCNQTIRGTRDVDGKTMKINKLNIYEPAEYASLLKMIKTGKSENFLMYRNDRRTWDDMLKILEDYSDAKNAFSEYEKETGDYFRKYSKKHNGPRITNMKYLDGEVNSCIDISHKYGYEKGSRRVILESLNPYRMDVYYHSEKELYYLVGLKYSDFKFENGVYSIDRDAYNTVLRNEKMIKEDETIDSLSDLGYEYRFSLYKGEIIEYEKNGEIYTERFLSRTMPKNRNYIETKPVDAPKFEKGQNRVGIAKTKSVRKIRTDILGNRYYCDREKFTLEVDNI